MSDTDPDLTDADSNRTDAASNVTASDAAPPPGYDADRVDALVDGPTGVRSHTSTAFASSIALAATWDRDLSRGFGRALASEMRGAGHDVVLAPGVNIIRVPQCGRAFEYYSEDPELAAEIGVGTVGGIQSGGVVATVKHFVANNQEVGRHHASSEVGERALREIYLPAFERAVRDADVGAVMAAYNRVRGTYMTEHRRLLTDVLKDEWDFSGLVVSDREGCEVVQIYVRDAEASVERPPRELASFAAVDLDADDSRTLTCDLAPHDFAFYEDAAAWTVEAGEFELLVGRSSRDIRSRVAIEAETDLTVE